MNVPMATERLHLCYVKLDWNAAWVQMPDLKCRIIKDAAAPNHAEANFEFKYGHGMLQAIGNRPADAVFRNYDRRFLRGYYVKVVDTLDGWEWFGIITDRDDDQEGDLNETLPSGTERYSAKGLTYLLETMSGIRWSWVLDSAGDPVRIDGAIPFNASVNGRRSNEQKEWKVLKRHSSGNWVFVSPREPNTELATGGRALEYVFQHFYPTDLLGAVSVPVRITGVAPDYELAHFSYEGQTLWEILNRIVSRDRAIGFNATVSDQHGLSINVWSYTPVDIPLPGGGYIPANPNQTTFAFDGSVNIKNAVLSDSGVAYFDQIHVYGDFRGGLYD